MAGRPVVHLWGVLETGESFLVRDRRFRPHFYLLDADAERAAPLGAADQHPSRRTTFDGRPVVRVELTLPSDTPPVRERLHRAGIPTFQADVPFAMLYLAERGIRGSLAIHGESRPGRRVDRLWDDPELEPAEYRPRLRVLSIDIETDPRARRVLSVALHGCGASEVLLGTPAGMTAPAGATPFATERDLLAGFGDRVRQLDPDVLTGWNVVDFDLSVLARRAAARGVPLELGRGRGVTRITAGRGREGARARIPGRLVLDGIQLLRGAFVRLESYSLEAVSRELLGEGKLIAGGDRGRKILDAFRDDRERFVEYNLTDARLVTDILEKLELVELAVERSRLTGLPPDRVASSVAAFDFLYLSALHPRGIVAPTAGARPPDEVQMGGGHVFVPEPGLYRNVLLFDVRSLYPSLIRTFQIDPLGYVAEPGPGEDLVVAPNGAAFRRQDGILPRMVEELFPRRAAAQAAGDRVASHAIKILMNSFFGVLGTPVCRFFNPEIANAITSWGRELLIWSRDWIEAGGRRVLYGDTDSLFVEAGEDDPGAARRVAAELVSGLNAALARHLAERWRVESRIEVEFEDLYLKLFLPSVRGGGRGARKRYAGLVEREGEPRVVLTGLEAVRRDWTELARRAQRELYERLFRGRPVAPYLADLVRRIRAGELDDQLVYRKALRKSLDQYTATTPPHVAAARQLRRPGRLISYVITTAGPEPAGHAANPLDYEHYLERQLLPVAEPVLAFEGLDFRKAIGDDHQLDLF